jgi:hydroxymethylpyrimidine/phosphomethylpyrimidine kinase
MVLSRDVKCCLSVAGSDSGGEAGLQADLQAFTYFGCHGLTAVSAVTAQNPDEILSRNEVSLACFEDQLKALQVFPVAAAKTGALVSQSYIEVLLDYLPEKLVVDPLMISSSGVSLLDANSCDYMKSELIPKATILTPNLPEAEFLLGEKEGTMEAYAKALFQRYGVAVYLKGGHSLVGESTDYFICEDGLWSLSSEKLVAPAVHGTGCRLSSALCANLALGNSLIESALASKVYMQEALSSWARLPDGRAVLMPVSSRGESSEVELIQIH